MSRAVKLQDVSLFDSRGEQEYTYLSSSEKAGGVNGGEVSSWQGTEGLGGTSKSSLIGL